MIKKAIAPALSGLLLMAAGAVFAQGMRAEAAAAEAATKAAPAPQMAAEAVDPATMLRLF